MNDHDEAGELPELTDEAILLLHRICELATQSAHPPFKALFDAYDRALEEQHVEPEHDAVIFRYLMRVGDSTRYAKQGGRKVDLVERLRDLLEAQGITLLQDGEHDPTQPVSEISTNHAPVGRRGQRRVSFHDAGVEERWLSEHSESLLAEVDFRNQAVRHPGHSTVGRRARSVSSQRLASLPQPVTRVNRSVSPSTTQTSETQADGDINPTLLFEVSHTQLVKHAEAFLYTSDLRQLRRILHFWHESAIDSYRAHQAVESVAIVHDHKTLLRQAWDQWLAALAEQRQERQRIDRLERHGTRALHVRGAMLVRKAFEHWNKGAKKEQQQNWASLQHILMVRYFGRWKAYTIENHVKARSILTRRYLAVLQDQVARKSLQEEQAVTHYHVSLMNKCQTTWLWSLYDRRVVFWHNTRVLRHSLKKIQSTLVRRKEQHSQANDLLNNRIAVRNFHVLRARTLSQQQTLISAEHHRYSRLLSECFSLLRKQATLGPITREFTVETSARRLQASFVVWRGCTLLSLEAAAISHHRVLQNAWTTWNDALRCKALAQRIEDRIVLETLYKWLLLERLRMFQRSMNVRLVGRAFLWWRSRVGDVIDRVQWAERVFEEGQYRRRQAFGMQRLHMAMRKREDAERAAVEFANGRHIPRFFELWKERSENARRLVKWAADASFYFLASSNLKLWREKTTEHRHNRKREAYGKIRTRVKFRIAKHCLGRWAERTDKVRSMVREAEHCAHMRTQFTAANAIRHLHDGAARIMQMEVQATSTDQQKLLSSALASILLRQADLAGTDEQALVLRHDIDLAMLSATLKKIQWAQFTAARRVESADALWARNRDTHVRHMLRHWAGRVAAQRIKEHQGPERMVEEPESPSLRPASRANLRSTEKLTPHPVYSQFDISTPGYMRTPSRSQRRAGRFRLLPAPAAVTPMAFDRAYLVTTPAPVAMLTTDIVRDASVVPAVLDTVDGLTPQITPFARKLRAGGFTPVGQPPSALRSSVFDRGGGGTSKSVRFARSARFGGLGSSGGDSARSGDRTKQS